MRGVLFIEPLFHQTIAGKKTMTRRSGGLEMVNENPDDWYISGEVRPSRVPESIPLTIDRIFSPIFSSLIFNKKNTGLISHVTGGIECKPRYKVGEVLYIKEPYRIPFTDACWYRYNMYPNDKPNIYDWKNKLFMPAKAARAFIRITCIKCERLMDISNNDCLAEGIERVQPNKNWFKFYHVDGTTGSPRESFISLYKFANKVKEVPNLWVWCYSYEYLRDYKHDR